MNVCVCVSECVRSICFPSYIHTRSCPLQFSHTYTNTHTCHLCHFWCVQLAWPPVYPPQVPDCVPVCLPGLCVRLFIFLPVCLPALWSQATRAFFFFNCFLPPTGPKHREAQQCSLCLESVDRERERQNLCLHFTINQAFFMSLFISFTSTRGLSRADAQLISRRLHRTFSSHTCVVENKSWSIRVFSLTRGLRTISG